MKNSKRQWTTQQKNAWIENRIEYRRKKGKEPLDELRLNDPDKYKATMEMERSVLKSRLGLLTKKSFSWPIDKSPPLEFLAPFDGVLHLPYNFQQKYGFHKIKFSQYQPLNTLIYNFYQEKVGKDYKGVNFVSEDSICPQRHEYLGPRPRVAGYQFDEEYSTASIEWYDDHIEETWIGAEKWEVDVCYDGEVEGWVEKPRSSFSKILDQNYLGIEE